MIDIIDAPARARKPRARSVRTVVSPKKAAGNPPAPQTRSDRPDELQLPIAAQITADTLITEAGAAANRVVSWCSYDIEDLANEVTLLGDECSANGETRMGSLLRCYGTRIAELNSVLMSYLTSDHITLGDAHRAVYRGAKQFDPKKVL